MMVNRNDPFRQLNFIVEIDGVAKAGFTYCDLPVASSPVIEYREGTDHPTTRKLPGLNEYGPVVLATGVTPDSFELFEWRAQVELGQIEEARRSVGIVLLDAAGNAAARWELNEAWPAAYDAPRLSATANEVAIERLIIIHEGFGRIEMKALSDEEGRTGLRPPNLASDEGRTRPRIEKSASLAERQGEPSTEESNAS